MRFLVLMLSFLSSLAFAQAEVTPITSYSVDMQHHGLSWRNTYVRFLVKTLSPEKKVEAIFKQEGDPEVVQASYVGPANAGFEVWEALKDLKQEPASFQLRVTQGSSEFQSEAYELPKGVEVYRKQNVQQLMTKEFSGNYASFVAVVRSDLAYHKNVEAHYSFDGFATSLTLPLAYKPFFNFGYGVIESPSVQHTELWSGQIQGVPSDVQEITFYLSYEANGVRYYDNNFGHNYKLKRFE